MRKPSKIASVLEKLKVRGHTAKELKALGFIPSQVRKAVPRGWILFEQRNDRNEQVYCLFRKSVLNQKIAEKNWDYAVAKKPDPYLVVQFPNMDFPKLKIFLMGDIHVGSPQCDIRTLRQDIEWIAQNDNVFVVLLGDLIENATRNSIGSGVYEQLLNPNNQVKAIIDLLSPIAHKCLLSIGSNHEMRSYKDVGIDIAQMIADKLEIPYFKGQCFTDILWKGQKWMIHAQHGSSASQTKGGKLNRAAKVVSFTGFTNWYLSAHVHDRLSNEVIRIERDPVNMRLIERKQYVTIIGSYLRYFGGYGEAQGYSPASRGRTVLVLHENGNYNQSE